MDNRHADRSMSRRGFVGALGLTGTAGLLGVRPQNADADPPPETTTLRLLKGQSICWAPQYVAEELLRAEGFKQVSYVDMPGSSGSKWEIPLSSSPASMLGALRSSEATACGGSPI